MDGKDLSDPHNTAVTSVSLPRQDAGPEQACLVVILGDGIGRKVVLGRMPVTIGRSSHSDLQLDQESVSRCHARLERRGHGYTLKDLGSTNGTLVNDEMVDVDGCTLRDGDHIRIGRAILKFISGNNVEAQYHEAIYAMMTTDGLTQVHNKRYFEDALDREVARCVRYSRSFGLVMFDIDHFKQVNDTHGHLAGDEILRGLGHAVRTRVRRNDVVARVGGEEFAVLLPESDLEGAIAFGEKLRSVVESTRFSFEGTHIPVTISVGAAGWRPDYDAGLDLMKVADGRLYEAKQGGRNRVCG
jgi:diguanylate cyclase (GGDEF)-like protein